MTSAATNESLIVGTRMSPLARRQTELVIERLRQANPDLDCQVVTIVTAGDQIVDRPLPEIGGKGLFTAELERALLQREIDIAVHSLKDLPVDNSPGLIVGAIPVREDARDVLVARNGWTRTTLPAAAVVGTCSVRREAQFRALRPDARIRPIRGNVDTRVRKVALGEYDAAIFAAAGLLRLGLSAVITDWLSLEAMLPAPGQGALAIQCRAGDERVLRLIRTINDTATTAAVTAEREFLRALGGGCSAPIAAFASAERYDSAIELKMTAGVISTDGLQAIRLTGQDSNPVALARRLADEAMCRGASQFLSTTSVEQSPQPLCGKRIVVTRPADQSAELMKALADHLAVPISIPTIRIEAVADPKWSGRSIDAYDWIVFTSVNGVRHFRHHWTGAVRARIAAVGPATAAAVSGAGLNVHLVPDEFVGEALAKTLGQAAGQRILLPRAESGDPTIVELLKACGAIVDDVPVYRTLPVEINDADRQQLKNGVDLAIFASGSAVRGFCRAIDKFDDLKGWLTKIPAACIGPTTARVAREHGLNVAAVARDHSTNGLVRILREYFSA